MMSYFHQILYHMHFSFTYAFHDSTSDDLLVLAYELGFFQPVFSRGKATAMALPFFTITWEQVWTRAVLKNGADSVCFFSLNASIS